MRYSGMIDLFATAWELALDQYKDSPKLKSLIKAFVGNGQPFEEAVGRLARWADIDSAEGAWLDVLGSVRNLPRRSKESDGDYRDRLKATLTVDNAGTPDYAIGRAKDFSGDAAPQYMEEAPAVFFVYTPGGSQIRRSKLRQVAPAGALGLPGAAIETGSGLKMATAGGLLILAAAQDKDIGT